MIFGYQEILADNKVHYGRHYPNANAAVDYIYGAEGTWGKLDQMLYTYNYYEKYKTAKHPFSKEALLKEAATAARTCRDANGHLLFDKDGKEEEIVHPIPADSFAFCEHTGKGSNGKRGTPFYNYWYDDNILARNMSRVYGKPEAKGLLGYGDFVRWSVMGDSLANYKLYNTSNIDCLALDGIYHWRIGNFDQSHAKWAKINSSNVQSSTSEV